MPMRVLRQCLLFALYLHQCQHESLRTATFSICVPDGVAGPESNPLRDWAVLLLRLRKLLLRAK